MQGRRLNFTVQKLNRGSSSGRISARWLAHTQLTKTVLQCDAMQQLSAEVFKLSFEYLHTFTAQKGAIFAEK